MKPYIYILAIIFSALSLNSCSTKTDDEEMKQLKNELRQVLNDRKIYTDKMDSRIAVLEKQYSSTDNILEKYSLLHLIIRLCYKYDTKLAFKYINEAVDLAKKNDKSEWIHESCITLSEIEAGTGLLKEASDEINKINVNELSDRLKTRYYLLLSYYYSHLSNNAINDSKTKDKYQQKANAMGDSAYVYCHDPADRYYWYNYSHLIEKYADKADLLIEYADKLDKTDFVYPQTLFTLSQILRNNKDQRWLKYCIIGSICDVKLANHDVPSLYILGGHFSNTGELDLAYLCFNYCYDSSSNYDTRIFQSIYAKTLYGLYTKYTQEMSRNQKVQTIFIYVLLILIIIIITIAILLYLMNRKMIVAHKALEKANEEKDIHLHDLTEMKRKLEELNNTLEQTNLKLLDSNNIKEVYIGEIFKICSSYIEKLEKFKQNIHRKLVVNQIKEATALTVSKPSYSNGNLMEFNTIFDSIFLHLRPAFIEEFNSLFKPEDAFLSKDGTLCLEQRIYALYNLGITESNKIALFLHYSPQTIYNIRMKVRNMSIYPKDEFLHRVAMIGKGESDAKQSPLK